jgi:hypothetical protein
MRQKGFYTYISVTYLQTSLALSLIHQASLSMRTSLRLVLTSGTGRKSGFLDIVPDGFGATPPGEKAKISI